MNPEIKQKWVEALRSGKYQQCKQELKDKSGAMCCLGVLREIVSPGNESSYGDFNMMLTDEFLSSIGWALDSTTLLPPPTKFAEMNDNGSTFNLIADKIEIEL